MSDEFDLATLDVAKASNSGAEIELLHPVTKEELGMFVGVVGRDSDAFRDWVSNRTDEEKKLAFQFQRKGKLVPPLTSKEADEKAVELLVACTTYFRCKGGKYLRYRGENMEFNEANATKFYSDPGMRTFYDQINEGISDLANFIKT